MFSASDGALKGFVDSGLTTESAMSLAYRQSEESHESKQIHPPRSTEGPRGRRSGIRYLETCRGGDRNDDTHGARPGHAVVAGIYAAARARDG